MEKNEILKITGKENYSFEDLKAIFKYLRGDNGCPWDRVQTHESIRANLIEETYEVVEAIDNKDSKLLKEELGDLLLQVVFHAAMEEEEGRFDLDGVINDIADKLVRRHPHVFGEETANDADGALDAWEKAKKVEKKDRKTIVDSMNSVPPSLPALMRAKKVYSKAKKDGFDLTDEARSYTESIEKFGEIVKNGVTDPDTFSTISADVLAALSAISSLYDVDIEEKLNKKTEIFINLYQKS